MILFLIFLSVMNGYILKEAPIIGIFFIIITSIICIRRTGSKIFLLLQVLLTAIVTMAVFILPESMEEGDLDYITVTGYKYYQDGVSHIVSADGKTFDMFLDDETVIPIGQRCRGPFEIIVPGEERNFIKKDDMVSLRMNGLDGRIYTNAPDAEACHDDSFTFSMHLAQARDHYINKIIAGSEHGYVYDILTLSIGSKSYITSDFFDALQKLGIYHLYVISGTHVAFISAILFYALKGCRLTINTIKIIMIAALLLFLSLNFFSPSVFRAVLMAVLLILTSFVRKKPYLAVISLTAIVQVVFNPWVMYNAGFQLSYITTYLIILSRNYWQDATPAGQLIGITAIAEVSTLVVILQQFNEISISGLIMNMIFVPLFSFVIFPMVILYNVMAFTIFPGPFDSIYHFVFSGFRAVVLFLADMFRHRFSITSPNAFWLIILIVLSYSLMKEICLKHIRRTLILAAVFFICILMINTLSWNDYTITMVDVGQGDAFVIEDHRSGSVVLIDTGGRYYPEETAYRLSEKTLLPYLKESGIDRIDMLVLSHMDLDHTGEADHILKKRDVDYIYVNPYDPAFNEWYNEKVPQDSEVKFINAMESEVIRAGGIELEKLFPYEEIMSEDSNQHSLVMKVSAGEYDFLFTGDTDQEMESHMIEKYGKLDIDVLKLAHHGSDTSTGDLFVENTNFKYALVSAGVENRYGHPHEAVMDRMDGRLVLDTSRHGMVRINIRGNRMCIETKLEPELNHCIKKELNHQLD